MENFRDITLGSIWIGSCINTDDPLKLGRVKVKVFSKYDKLSDDVIPWSIPYNQLSSGTVIIPKVGELVNVFFENGDTNVPFYVSSIIPSEVMLSETEADYPKVWSIVYDNRLGEDGTGTTDTERTLQIFYTESQGLIIKKNESIINIKNEDESILFKNGSTEKAIHIFDDGISIGTEGGSAEPAVLGDMLEELLNSLITELGKIGAISTPAGPSNLLSTSPQWQPMVTKFKEDWKKFKSELVTID